MKNAHLFTLKCTCLDCLQAAQFYQLLASKLDKCLAGIRAEKARNNESK